MKVSITVQTCDLSDKDLQQMVQLGVDCVDFGKGGSFPGVQEQGYPDLDKLLQLKRRIRSWGMDINRVTLPDVTEDFMQNRPGSEKQLENIAQAMKVFGEAKIPIARQRLAGDVFDQLSESYKAVHRGGMVSRGETVRRSVAQEPPSLEQLDRWWEKFNEVYSLLVPIADEYDIKLGMHPSDTPHPNTPFGGLGLHRLIDAYPSKNVGLIYCVGSRGEAGGTPLVLDEIHQFGRKGRIFLCHFRNVRGSLATAGAFEEAMLDDGDMNMPRILLELKKVRFDGCINPDHIALMGDAQASASSGKWAHSIGGWKSDNIGWAYSIGYVKALLAAMDEFTG
ncbi:mannonate dehydratase [Paenibacillus sp. NPDC056579]|uniref:mannonate dehydratase n=1 Tax=Paenibacillus sp. NPDC056579 TaxID=3345871 RepID=UPI0036D019FD